MSTRLLAGAAAALIITVAACTSPAMGTIPNERGKAQTCGVLPGDGAYSYVKVWNVGCAKAKKVAGKVSDQFCGPRFQKCDTEVGEFIRGHEDYRKWDCGLKTGWEFHRVRCEAPHKRFVQESAA
jgi:hypothetical protein